MSFPKLSIVPPSVGLGLFLFVFVFVFFIWFWASLHWFFFFLLKIFGSFGFFFMPPSFVRALLIIEKFLLCPPVLFGHFQSLRFFLCSHTCLPVWGVILVKVISKKITRLKRGLQRIYFSLVKGLSNMAFLYLKCMHLGSVSLAFMRVCKMISHYSFK